MSSAKEANWAVYWRWQNWEVTKIGSVVTNNKKYDAEIGRCTELVKDVYQKLSTLLRHRKILSQ